MPLKLYKMDLSPPVYAVLMVCEIHKIPVEMVDIDLFNKDQLKPEYLEKNPLHTIPLLEDGDLYIHDSHVILTYLTEVYGKDKSLYPKDPKQRALVDQKLYFDTLLFTCGKNINYAAVYEGVRKPPQKFLNDLEEAYGFIETFLTKTKFIASDKMTVADLSVVSTAAALRFDIPIDGNKVGLSVDTLTKFRHILMKLSYSNVVILRVLRITALEWYPKFQAWFSYMEKQPFFQKYAAPGSEALGKILKEKLDL